MKYRNYSGIGLGVQKPSGRLARHALQLLRPFEVVLRRQVADFPGQGQIELGPHSRRLWPSLRCRRRGDRDDRHLPRAMIAADVFNGCARAGAGHVRQRHQRHRQRPLVRMLHKPVGAWH